LPQKRLVGIATFDRIDELTIWSTSRRLVGRDVSRRKWSKCDAKVIILRATARRNECGLSALSSPLFEKTLSWRERSRNREKHEVDGEINTGTRCVAHYGFFANMNRG